MKNKILFLIIFASNILFAQGKAGSLFLSINPGRKSNGMGEAQIGIANDVYASYYNPAGLTNLQSKQFSFMHTSYLPNLVDDMAYDFLTFAMPISNSESIGGYFSYLDLGDQISTDDNGNNIGSFSSYMYALNLSYAKKINDSSSWGVNGKYFYQELAVINSIDASKGSLAFDVSYFEENFLNNPNLNFGAILSNVGPEVSFDDGEKDPLPTRLGLGVSMLTLENKAMVALDLNYELNDSSMIYNFGAEYKIVDNFVARAGFINNSSGNINYTTIGFGVDMTSLGLDLSYIIGDELDPHTDMIRFSINGSF